MIEVARLTWSAQRSLVAWTLAVAGLSAAAVAFHGRFSASHARLVDGLPREWRPGCATGDPGLECFLGDYAAYMPLLLGAFAILHGSRAIAGEIDRGTISLLLAQPVARSRVLGGKTLALGLDVVLLCLAASAGLVAGALIAGHDARLAGLALVGVNMLPATLAILALALLGSTLFSTPAAAVPAALYASAAYVVDLVASSAVDVQALTTASVFHLLSRSQPYALSLDAFYWVMCLAAAAVLWAIAAWRLDARDL